MKYHLLIFVPLFLLGVFLGVEFNGELRDFESKIRLNKPTKKPVEIEESIGLLIEVDDFQKLKNMWREDKLKYPSKHAIDARIEIDSVQCDMTFERFEEMVGTFCKINEKP